jgi:mannose-6-phosphate isomerase
MKPLAATHPPDGSRRRGMDMAEVTYQRGDSDERPWGRWEVLDTGGGFAVKRITVAPGAALSLELLELQRNQSVFIPVGTAHRIENLGDEPVEFVEVQVGDRLDESDIVRLEDRYGRL